MKSLMWKNWTVFNSFQLSVFDLWLTKVASVQNVNSLDGKSSISEHIGTNFQFTSVLFFKIFATTPHLPVIVQPFTVKTKAVLLQNAFLSPNFGQIFCHSTSVPISLQVFTVKTTAIWQEKRKIRPNLPCFSRPKGFIDTFETSFFSAFHSTINKQGYSGGTSLDIVIKVIQIVSR